MNLPNENDVLTARSTAFVLLMLTILLTSCWILMDDSRVQAATFVCGVISIVAWLSYCQQKTTSEVSAIVAKHRRSK